MRRVACVTLFFLFLAGIAGRCEAQIPVTDVLHIAVTVFDEVERYGQAVEDYIAQGEQIYNQYKQIANQVKALEKLDVHTWRDLSPEFARLLALVNEADAVLYNTDNLEERFFETFPAGEAYTNYTDDSWQALYRTMETLRISLQSVHEITSSDETDLESLATIEGEIQGAQGHEEVLESIGDLLSWNAKQALLTERITASQANAEAVAKAYEINEAARSRESYANFIEGTVTDAIGAAYDDSSPAFQALPDWVAQ
jgi:P-type conjugative transfer protein TrbJ